MSERIVGKSVAEAIKVRVEDGLNAPLIPSQARDLAAYITRIEAENERLQSENEGLRGATTQDTSDGYHTFRELYHQRAVLFAALINGRGEAWKSRQHFDGTMFDGYFIVGIKTPEGDYTYHYELELWDLFDVREITHAPEWDGHTADDVVRLLSLAAIPTDDLKALVRATHWDGCPTCYALTHRILEWAGVER